MLSYHRNGRTLNKFLTAGAALIVLGVIPYVSMWLWVGKRQQTWRPLSTRITLHTGQWISPQFETSASTGYRLLLEMDRNLPFQRMECLLGLAGRDSDNECAGVSEIDDIHWTVRSGGAVIAHGSSRDISDGSYSNTISKTLGGFEANKGARYTVVLNILEDASELNRTNPRLVIQTFPGYWEGTIILWQLTAYAGVLAVGSGLLVMLVAIVRRWRARRHMSRA